MSEHITEWLNALLDGELHGPRLRQVQDHLAGCALCRAELDDLSRLSQVLKAAAPAESDLPADRFIAELTLLLPRRDRSASPHRAPENIAWWLVPAGAVAVWALLQAGLSVGGLISTAGAAGLLDGAASWFSSAPHHTAWFSATMSLFGSQLGGNGLSLLDVLDNLSVLRSELTGRLASQAGFGLLYWAGLIFWLTLRTRAARQDPARKAPARSWEQPGQGNRPA
jgi:Putative zinc-finger